MTTRNPSDQTVLSKIRPGAVFFWKTSNVGYDSEAVHFYIVVNRNPLTDKKIYLCWISKKVKEIKAMRSPKFFQGSLIEISPSDYDELSIFSIIDCNRIEQRSLDEIINKYRQRKLEFKKDLSMGIMEKIWEAIRRSPTVSDEIKDQLILCMN